MHSPDQSPPPAGALFDWDGVIIDSSTAHRAAWALMAEELAMPLTDGFFEATFGMRNDRILPHFTPWVEAGDTVRITALGLRKEALYREVIRRDGIAPLPGVVTLLDALREAGIPCAVGTSTDLENVRLIMELTGLGPYFQDIAAAADVARGKPEPDVFLCAARKIGQDPLRCFVVEDAHVGITAAKRAGCKAVAVATTHPVDTFAEADLALASLTELTLPRLQALWD